MMVCKICALFGTQALGRVLKSIRARVLEISSSGSSRKGTGGREGGRDGEMERERERERGRGEREGAECIFNIISTYHSIYKQGGKIPGISGGIQQSHL